MVMTNPKIDAKRQFSLQVKLLFFVFYVCVSLAMMYGAIKLYDIYLQKKSPGAMQVVYGALSERPEIVEYNLYPYLGFMVQPNYHVTKPGAYGNYYDSYDFKTGDHGFPIDFDLDAPPPKPKGTFRIIVTGGSTAWGQEARSNQDTYYSILERMLNQRAAGQGFKVEIINLAMGGATTYQNYIALNKWAHALQPDMIMSFSGRNDLLVPRYHESGTDMPLFFHNVMGLVEASKHSNSPAWLKKLAKLFPGIFSNTQLGTALRVLNLKEYSTEARGKYILAHWRPKVKEVCDPIALYAHALKSIKRDFSGCPIFLVFQPMRFGSFPPEIDMEKDYRELVRKTVSSVSGYMNDNWRVINLHEAWDTKGRLKQEHNPTLFVDDCHFTNEGHMMVAKDLVDQLYEFILKTRKKS